MDPGLDNHPSPATGPSNQNLFNLRRHADESELAHLTATRRSQILMTATVGGVLAWREEGELRTTPPTVHAGAGVVCEGGVGMA